MNVNVSTDCSVKARNEGAAWGVENLPVSAVLCLGYLSCKVFGMYPPLRFVDGGRPFLTDYVGPRKSLCVGLVAQENRSHTKPWAEY